jgi:IclR family acetate operon transcriptional repressor
MRSHDRQVRGRILDVLELLAGRREGVRVNQLARALAMPKSSASALLGTLAVRGYVEATGEGYCLAESYRGGGWVGGMTGSLVRVGRSIMERLVTDTGESAFLGVATASMDVRYIAKVVSANPLRYDVELESLRPAHSTSIGRVLLASLAPDALDAYFRTHDLSRTSIRPDASERSIRRALNAVRAQGYATIADSHVLGTSGAAAPVSAGGRVVAGLAIIAPTARFDAARDRIVPHVVAAARELGRGIGGAANDAPATPARSTARLRA